MKIRFESHALKQMQERKIDKKLIEETLINPLEIVSSKKNRNIAQKIFKIDRFKFLIRVIYVIENSDFVVISVYQTTKIKKYLVKK